MWRVRGSSAYLYVRFDAYGPRGEVINKVRISSTAPSNLATIPTRRTLTARELSVIGRIRLGMTRGHVLQAIHGRLPFPSKVGRTWRWRQRGFIRRGTSPYDNDRLWLLEVEFQNGRVSKIEVSSHW